MRSIATAVAIVLAATAAAQDGWMYGRERSEEGTLVVVRVGSCQREADGERMCAVTVRQGASVREVLFPYADAKEMSEGDVILVEPDRREACRQEEPDGRP